MTWAILVINIKGGTGKSTVAEELSKELRDAGNDVGILDADIDSANLATRLGATGRVTFKGDHTIKPVEHNGMKLYSMENAFEDSSFSQNGQFMREVIENMVNHSEWGDLDYMVVDCPPGSSDVFEELVRALRANILGAVSVGISDAVEDTARLVQVCNHNWVPIIGFIENMSGAYCHGETLDCNNEEGMGGHAVEPFGRGKTEEFSDELGGEFLGEIPLCIEDTEINEVAEETFARTVEVIESKADEGAPQLPEDNVGERGFIRNVWGSIKEGIKQMNNEMDISSIQEKYGVEGRDPLVMKIELTDASGLTSILSEIVITVSEGDIKPLSVRKAKKKGISIEGGIRISSQDLYDSIKGEKKVMRSVNGEVITTPYTIVDAVRMGDAEVWGDRTINRLSVLDRILSDVIDMDEVREIMES